MLNRVFGPWVLLHGVTANMTDRKGSAMAFAAFTGFEEAPEGGGVRLVGAQLDGIDAGGSEEAAQFFLGFGLALGENGAFARIAGIDFDDLAGFGVFEDEIPERWEFEFEAIDNLDGDDIMAAVGLAESGIGSLAEGFRKNDTAPQVSHDVGASGVALAKKIREDDGDGAMGSDLVKEVEGLIKIGAAEGGLEEKDFADDAQDMAPAFAGRNKFFDGAGEEDQADFIVVADGGKSEDRGDFGGQFAFGLGAGAEQSGAAEIDQEHDGELAFFDEFFDEGMVHAGGDIPIDGADFIAGLVLADFLKVHALAFEDAVVLAGERFVNQAEGTELDLADFF